MGHDWIGSSPRVRGTLVPCRGQTVALRFIPACAGNAATGSPILWNAPVHPRVCGERIFACVAQIDAGGSSPRVRGTHGALVLGPSSRRFIPACAGNAIALRTAATTVAVHPRVCGERAIRHAPGGTDIFVSGQPAQNRHSVYLLYAVQGLMISTSHSAKSATLRVASAAPRDLTMAAICASN